LLNHDFGTLLSGSRMVGNVPRYKKKAQHTRYESAEQQRCDKYPPTIYCCEYS
jgi:hypothetical protein